MAFTSVVLFRKDFFSRSKTISWLTSHGYNANNIDSYDPIYYTATQPGLVAWLRAQGIDRVNKHKIRCYEPEFGIIINCYE